MAAGGGLHSLVTRLHSSEKYLTRLLCGGTELHWVLRRRYSNSWAGASANFAEETILTLEAEFSERGYGGRVLRETTGHRHLHEPGRRRPHFRTNNSITAEVLVLDLSVLLFTIFRPGVSARRFSFCIMRIEGHTMKLYKSESALMPDPYDRSYHTFS